MKLYVVQTCNGDVYFQGTRVAYKHKAMDMAVEQVLYLDTLRYDSSDEMSVRASKDNHETLYKVLLEIGALRIAHTRG